MATLISTVSNHHAQLDARMSGGLPSCVIIQGRGAPTKRFGWRLRVRGRAFGSFNLHLPNEPGLKHRIYNLEYEPSTRARDKALVLQNESLTGDMNMEFYTQNMEGSVYRMLKFVESAPAIDHPILPAGGYNRSGLDSTRASSAVNDTLKQPARADMYYKRDGPLTCA